MYWLIDWLIDLDDTYSGSQLTCILFIFCWWINQCAFSCFWGQFIKHCLRYYFKCLFFLPLCLFLLEKEMIPASKKLKRSVADVRRSSTSYSNNINSSWPRLLQKHNVSLSILLHIWSECKKSLECLTAKLRKLSTPTECWLFSNQSQ